MAKDKKSFVIYCDLIDAIDHLTTLEKGKLFEHLLDYVNDKNPVMKDRIILGSWKHIEQSLKRDLKKYEARAERSRDNGSLGGRPPKEPQKPSGLINNPDEPKKPDSDSDSDSVIVSDIDILLEKEQAFNEFWDLYDKKINQTKCKPKFLKLSENDRKLIMDYIPKYKLSQPNKKFRKDPMTFLNNDGWLDEIITEQDPSKPTNVLPTSFRS